MANGGIIGPINTVSACSQAEVITTITSSITGCSYNLQPATSKVSILVIAGGGGGGGKSASGVYKGSGGGAGGLRNISCISVCAEERL